MSPGLDGSGAVVLWPGDVALTGLLTGRPRRCKVVNDHFSWSVSSPGWSQAKACEAGDEFPNPHPPFLQPVPTGA